MTIAKDEDLPISQLVGYMLKIIKSERHISDFFKDRFNAIKHGDYDCFFDYIREVQNDYAIQWKAGVTKDIDFSQHSGDCDILMLHKIEPSIGIFFKSCYGEFQDHFDSDVSDLIYRKCAAFEISIKGQNNKQRQDRNLSYTNESLKKTIDEVCVYMKITDADEELLQNGRKFVNMVKRHRRKSGMEFFSSWSVGVAAFEQAWSVCDKYALKLCY